MDEKRPLFSIVIPCYNSKPELIKKLLQSIANNGCESDELEVIIADGRSTDKAYLEEVEYFKKDTKILTKIVNMPDKTEDGIDLINCPGNTREYGVREASGQWVTFIDHDDVFTDEAFKKIKTAIEETNEKNIVCSNILQIDPFTNSIIHEIKYATNWMHGKFYNLDNFWNKYNFHFKTNLQSNEDIYISSRVHCLLKEVNDFQVLWLEDFTYIWMTWPDSTSHITYNNELSYMEYFFFDYITATHGVYETEYDKLLKKYNGNISNEDKDFYKGLFADCLIFQFMYLQQFKFSNKNYILDQEKVVKQNIRNFYKRFNLTSKDFYELACQECLNNEREDAETTKIWYNSVRRNVTISCGNFIETDNFYDFISKV